MSRGGPTATSPLGGDREQDPALRRLVCVHSPRGRTPEARALEAEAPAEPLVLGREAGPDGWTLPDDTTSRRHAAVRWLPRYDCLQVEDLGSKNGTFVDGRRVQTAVLEPGAVIRVGHHLFVLDEIRLPASVAPTPTPDVAYARAWAELQVERAAASEAPILIHGPTGAGKERLAARVHEASGRRGAFVPVNCATLNRELLGSELFGHVKGAFSDARADRPGLVASADGGTLFLDEIAELPLDQQPALLRVLQERRLRPVGSDREVEVDVRVVSATHRDLEAESNRGAFRADLFARLAGLVIELPGLAARRVEILPLLGALAPDVRLGVEAAEALLLHDWPRNVRELQALANRIALFDVETVELSLLPDAIRHRVDRATGRLTEAAERASAGLASSARPADERDRPKPSREALEQLLTEHGGRVASVARSLALTRQSVYRLLEEHGLSASAFRRKKDA